MTDGVHFLTLYNPSKDAKAECKTVVCTEKPKANSRHGAEEEMKRGSGLLCLTTPNPFKTIPLYT
nr:suface antigen 31 [Eimeria intestinalis]